MDSAEIELAKLGLAHAQAAAKFAVAFMEAQSRLELAGITSAERLTSAEGLARSRETLAQLVELMARHKEGYATLVTRSTAASLAASEALPPGRREEYQANLRRSRERGLTLQGRFYAARQRWLDAVATTLDCAEQHADAIWREGDVLVCDSDEVLAVLQAAARAMDEASAEETLIMQQRQADIAADLQRMAGS